YPAPKPEIQNALDNIDIEFVKTDFPKLISSMRMGTQRIKEIVNSLRSFSRLDEAGTKTIDLHEGIENTLLIVNSRLRGNPEEKSIEVIKRFGQLPLVECYPGQLNQVFLNLLVNAVDALEPQRSPISSLTESSLHRHPAITITTQLEEAWAVISFADNGCGIPAAVLSRLFDPFFTTKPVGKGTGLGLSISYQVVTEKHSGQLECLSTPGEGTAFIIRIPTKLKK
ncbi:MAG: ATP-binding protein, partial [Cyanobacteria bacterium J06560_2]